MAKRTRFSKVRKFSGSSAKGMLGDTHRKPITLSLNLTDFGVRYVHVSAQNHRFALIQFLDVGTQQRIPIHTTVKVFQFLTGIRDICKNKISRDLGNNGMKMNKWTILTDCYKKEFFEFSSYDSTITIKVLVSDAKVHFDGLHFRQ